MSEIQQTSRDGKVAQARHVHLIGICGSAMASLAGMLQLQGWRVTGSDKAAYPPMSDLLEQLHIPIAQPFAEGNLEPRPDLVIVGNAISRGNPELEYVLDQRIPFRSLAQLIHEEFLVDRESLVIAGTHGKTTTTSMLAWIYETAATKQPGAGSLVFDWRNRGEFRFELCAAADAAICFGGR